MTDVDISTLSLIKETYNQEFYVENNGEMTENKRLSRPRRTVINHVGKYVFRIPGKKRSDKFTPQIMNSRMYRIKKYLGNPYLSFTGLFQSGMIQMAIDIYKEKGFVDKEDFIDICVRYNYENYWYNIRDLFNQYKEILLD